MHWHLLRADSICSGADIESIGSSLPASIFEEPPPLPVSAAASTSSSGEALHLRSRLAGPSNVGDASQAPVPLKRLIAKVDVALRRLA